MSKYNLNLQSYAPFYLSQIATKWSSASSRIYLRAFGIGINEWRVMSVLANEPGVAANRICAVTGFDKALIGRSIRVLEKRKLVVLREDSNDRRSQSIRLTASGLKVNDQIYAIAREREKLLLAGLTSKEIEVLLRLLRRLAANVATTPVSPPSQSLSSSRRDETLAPHRSQKRRLPRGSKPFIPLRQRNDNSAD